MTTLTLSDISRRYGAVQALQGVSLSLQSGEVHALMGENGAGKSTLIRILAGLERADSGAFHLDGAALPPLDCTSGLRFIHQELQIIPALSVAENMHIARPYPRRFGFVDWRALHRASARALARLGLSHIRPQQLMGDLGPGDQMLVRIAASLLESATQPWLYVMDEPTAALTGDEAARLFRVIRELVTQGAGVLYVSHRMGEVMELSQRVTILRDGRLIETTPIAKTDQAQIITAMTGRAMADLYPARAAAARTDTRLSVENLSSGRLQNASFTVARGEILGLAGLAGSGRGALLAALAGAACYTGNVTLDGSAPPRDATGAWRAGIAHVPPERRAEGLMLDQSITDNIALPHLNRLSRMGLRAHRRERALASDKGQAVRLKAASVQAPVASLSGGNQQKVLFARALAGNPRLLLLNEPTRGVDVAAKYDIYQIIRDLADSGTSVIIASSDLPELIGLCDRIAILREGHLTRVIANENLTEGGLLTHCYGHQGDAA
ncbi:sugar ABC transporter ATP-binding protein [Ketogulonicigenium vulgare]|uniref:Putative ABC transporter ATP-binding protein n=1 Tax=Ketogulonicigenium vulgare (strain WSH-001) TaxID=759362 RepID=F9YAF4_KETVW|nr:sugar ABC transporter ATP-binding protein [Ketogulonicigenium vulgare]ADO42119.1 ABC transporter related protein [Ketogulonicigenium vulgare Y25]AEM40327.1 putative ABC transporter ATP-binding protein [Ketogulonicigenium vulgare WSH-001]ALJ80522.1 ABC transporter ATP-binding protein [Ketogulonicigenium vulgare]ANW33347.1 ABC transporter ATP-binding protein [Ketogulonicigenium vulgare]AOZ54039.1 ABC transporter [Ketogulonicigenium vulgare]